MAADTSAPAAATTTYYFHEVDAARAHYGTAEILRKRPGVTLLEPFGTYARVHGDVKALLAVAKHEGNADAAPIVALEAGLKVYAEQCEAFQKQLEAIHALQVAAGALIQDGHCEHCPGKTRTRTNVWGLTNEEPVLCTCFVCKRRAFSYCTPRHCEHCAAHYSGACQCPVGCPRPAGAICYPDKLQKQFTSERAARGKRQGKFTDAYDKRTRRAPKEAPPVVVVAEAAPAPEGKVNIF
jgi:hypothetical protein